MNEVSNRVDLPLPRMAVVIPARNEERRLGRCLTAVEAAEAALREAYPLAQPSTVVVVLDRCTDNSEQVLARWPGIQVVHSNRGRVGGARAAGVEQALARSSGRSLPGWIACTDADSAVPGDWLITQLRAAVGGADLLLGLVRPDPAELSESMLWNWTVRHELIDGHPHVHGANLGIRSEMYLRVGGFPDVAVHEDVLLTERVRAAGGRVISTASSPVLTSARISGRTPAGMAGYLARLSSLDLAPARARELDAAVVGETG